MNRPRTHGFSLIELMIAVAIVGILAAVALPSYKESVLKGRRAEGRTALMELLQAQERYATQNNCYVGFATTVAGVSTATSPGSSCGGVTPASVPFKNYSGDSFGQAAYILSAGSCTGISIQDCVKVTATPKSADPTVGSISITSTGEKSCTGSDSSKCWR